MFHFWLNTFFVDTEHRCESPIRSDETPPSADDTPSPQTPLPSDHSMTHAQHLKTHTAAEPRKVVCKEHAKVEKPRKNENSEKSADPIKTVHSQFSCSDCYKEETAESELTPYCYKTVEFQKFEIDKAHKDKQHRIYSKDFTVSKLVCISKEDLFSCAIH